MVGLTTRLDDSLKNQNVQYNNGGMSASTRKRAISFFNGHDADSVIPEEVLLTGHVESASMKSRVGSRQGV